MLLFSCSKEDDNFKPIVTIHSPTNMQEINGIDTLIIDADFKDDIVLESIQVFLRDENDNVVLNAISRSPNTSEYHLKEAFFFDDIHLTSGRYYFTFKAFDGENTTLKMVDIMYNEKPKERFGIFLADANGSTINITLLDNSLNSSAYSTQSGDLTNIYVNSFNQHLYIATKTTGKLIGIDLLTSNVTWSDNSFSTITGFFANDDFVYLGLINGSIKRYNANGAFNFFSTMPVNNYMENAAIHENYFVIEQKSVSTSNTQLSLNWLASGYPVQQTTVNEDILGIYTFKPNQLTLFTNNAVPQGNLVFYYFSTGLTGSPFSINTAKIDDCEEIFTGEYLLAEGGNLTLINANSFSKLPYLNGVAAKKIKYDKFTNELFVINNNQLTIYDYASKSVKGTYVHTDSIIAIDFWYNK